MCRQGILICRRGWAPLTSALTTCTALSYTLYRYTIYTTDTLYTIDILYRYTIDTQHAPHCSAFRQSIGPHFRYT